MLDQPLVAAIHPDRCVCSSSGDGPRRRRGIEAEVGEGGWGDSAIGWGDPYASETFPRPRIPQLSATRETGVPKTVLTVARHDMSATRRLPPPAPPSDDASSPLCQPPAADMSTPPTQRNSRTSAVCQGRWALTPWHTRDALGGRAVRTRWRPNPKQIGKIINKKTGSPQGVNTQ